MIVPGANDHRVDSTPPVHEKAGMMGSSRVARRRVCRAFVAVIALAACSEPRNQPLLSGPADASPPSPEDAPVAPADAREATPLQPPPAPDPAVPLPAGAACTRDDQCGLVMPCIDGICCKETCSACQACSGPGGTCVNLPARTPDLSPPAKCLAVEVCDGAGACKRAQGIGCERHEQCLSGACFDQICCDRACGGTCESCIGDGTGTCSPVVTAQDEPSCTGQGQLCVGDRLCASVDQRGDYGGAGQSRSLARGEAQVVTVGRAGRLVAIGLGLTCQEAQTFSLTIDEAGAAGPPNRPLAPTLQLGRVPPTGRGIEVYYLARPLPVTANQRFMIVLRPVSGACAFLSAGTNGYSRGEHWYEPSPGAWQRSDDGTNLVFETLVVSP